MLMDRYPSGLERSWFKGCQAFTDSIFGKLGYAVDVQLFRKVAAVCLNSFGAYMQLLSKKVSLLIKSETRPAGFEPATYGLEIRCSIQLSYGRSLIYVRRGARNCTLIAFSVRYIIFYRLLGCQ